MTQNRPMKQGEEQAWTAVVVVVVVVVMMHRGPSGHSSRKNY